MATNKNGNCYRMQCMIVYQTSLCDSNQCYQFASLFLSDGEDSNTVPEKWRFSMDYAVWFLENQDFFGGSLQVGKRGQQCLQILMFIKRFKCDSFSHFVHCACPLDILSQHDEIFHMLNYFYFIPPFVFTVIKLCMRSF